MNAERGTKRIAACLEYDGSAFRGWQRQSHAPCVQIPVEQAFSSVADEPVKVVCAGRTDAGVHALCQVVHFDTRATRTDEQWRRGASAHLPGTVTVRWAQPVDDDFHARYSALSRQYIFIVINRREPTVLLRNYANHYEQPLDAEAMYRASRALVGEHDFSSFRASGCQANTPIRNIRKIRVTRVNDVIYFDFRANAFLQHMVRNMVGALLEVGCGEKDEDWPAWLLAQRDRRKGGVTVAPCGLYLTDIEYPRHYPIRHVDFPTLLFGLLFR